METQGWGGSSLKQPQVVSQVASRKSGVWALSSQVSGHFIWFCFIPEIFSYNFNTSLIHLLTYLLTDWLTYFLTSLLITLLIFWLTHLFTYSLTYSLTDWLPSFLPCLSSYNSHYHLSSSLSLSLLCFKKTLIFWPYKRPIKQAKMGIKWLQLDLFAEWGGTIVGLVFQKLHLPWRIGRLECGWGALMNPVQFRSLAAE